MAKASGKVQAKSWQPPTQQTANKETLAARPFPEIARPEASQETHVDRAELKETPAGGMIENINRSLAAASPPDPLPTLGLGGVQAKLTLGTPGDVYEQEADRVARQVVDEIHSSAFRASPPPLEGEDVTNGGDTGRVQRQITVQALGNAGGEMSSEWEAQLQGAKSGGQPLSPLVKEPMERSFGADFGSVRVHTGAQADGLAQSIQAKAFTTGQDVFFRQGAYEPESRGGQELIAHELTHVVQQSGGAVMRSCSHLPPQLEIQMIDTREEENMAKANEEVQRVNDKNPAQKLLKNSQKAIQRIQENEMEELCSGENVSKHKFEEYFQEVLKIQKINLYRAGGQWTKKLVKTKIPNYKEWLGALYTEAKESKQYAPVQQGQFIISHTEDNITGLSTTGAAPCLVVSLKSKEAKVYGLAHLDSGVDAKATIEKMLKVGYARVRKSDFQGSYEQFCATVKVMFGGGQKMGAEDESELLTIVIKELKNQKIEDQNINKKLVAGNDFYQSRNMETDMKQMNEKERYYLDALVRLKDYHEKESLTYNLLSNIMYSAIFSIEQKTKKDDKPVKVEDLIEKAVGIAVNTTHEEEEGQDERGERMKRITREEKIELIIKSMETMVKGEYVYPETLSQILMGWC